MTKHSEQTPTPTENLTRPSSTLPAESPFPSTLQQWRNVLRNLLNLTSATPGLDSRVLLAHILRRPQSWLLAHPEYHLTQEETQRLSQAFDRLNAGIPLPYVLGQREFFGLTFQLTPDVLIPRPETELLVEEALAWLGDYPERRRAVDLGTGSGCIAISLAKHCPDLALIATDISREALDTAYQNARRHQVEGQIEFRQGNLWGPLDGQFDLICANLPYIPTRTLRQLAVFGKEPTLALDGGLDGLDSLRRFLRAAPQFLAPGGLLLAEIEASQGPAVLSLARKTFPRSSSQVLPDLAGHDRLLRLIDHSHPPNLS